MTQRSHRGGVPAAGDGLTSEQRKTRALAQLRQATWAAAQFVALTDIERFVAGCLDEIRSDEP